MLTERRGNARGPETEHESDGAGMWNRRWQEEAEAEAKATLVGPATSSRSSGRRPAHGDVRAGPWLLRVALLGLVIPTISAAFIHFDNCLDQSIIHSNPVQLQFTPLRVWARFDTVNATHNLNLTVYGNVSGSATTTPPPPPDAPGWNNPSVTLGKIVDLSEANNKFSTFFAKFQFLSYTPFLIPPARFCSTLVRGSCPLGPVFNASSDDVRRLPAFSVDHNLFAPYSFTSLTVNFRAASGDAGAAKLACVSVNITPDLGNSVRWLLVLIPVAILVLVGLATAFAAIWSPWGSADIFRWTSNYGRDVDLLRLVTPGFGDCLQYIQFAFLTAALSLNYPGYFQPVMSQLSWSALMFNTSLVTHGPGTQSLIDGIYVANGSYGMDRMSQLVGMTSVRDIWAGAAIWLLAIVCAVVGLIQLGFILRSGYRHLSHIQEEDLRAKNLPFTVGNLTRVVFNYLLLPLAALSTFQLVVARIPPHDPLTTAMAGLLLILLISFAVWMMRLIARIRPRSYLFDDLPTVLLYGSLYNTYSDDAAPFTMIPLLLQFVRGAAIGAVQPYGIAQLVLLAVCEVIFLLTLHAFRPFARPTSMNAFHTFFSGARLLTTMLSVAFVPSLAISEGSRGWVGYVILIMHAFVLVFCFLLNAAQTVIEVAARLSGAGGDGGAARGGLVKVCTHDPAVHMVAWSPECVFGIRQLSKRGPRRHAPGRQSIGSDAAFFGSGAAPPSTVTGGRPRSTSGSSTVLLNRHLASDGRGSITLDSVSGASGPAHLRSASDSAYTPTTPGLNSPFSFIPGEAQEAGPSDPYYRPPRPRRPAAEGPPPGARSRLSWAGGTEWASRRWSRLSPDRNDGLESGEGPSGSGTGTPVPANLSARDLSDGAANDGRPPRTDYAVREVDDFYNVGVREVRGPALSASPARRLGTGPADPTGPIASAASWIRGLFGGKTKEKEKGTGFEVVRRPRMPPGTKPRAATSATRPRGEADYRDESSPDVPDRPPPHRQPQGPLVIVEDTSAPAAEHVSPSGADADADAVRDMTASDAEGAEPGGPPRPPRASQLSPIPPSLPPIDPSSDIELPSRVGSPASSSSHRNAAATAGAATADVPTVPRKSPKRRSIPQIKVPKGPSRLAAVRASPPASPNASPAAEPERRRSAASSPRMPFRSSEHSSLHERRPSTDDESRASSLLPVFAPGDAGLAVPLPIASAAAPASGAGSGPGSGLASASASFHSRQTSLGFVPQHRASDSIHTVPETSAAGVDLQGRTAEILDVRAGGGGSSSSTLSKSSRGLRRDDQA
ncbi:MAG: hypothetical protein M1826_002528 [Phylliscum demangeonii]|nr:MAG: hypothetical protein M1826_002528 [Phylliscum demangeonii]